MNWKDLDIKLKAEIIKLGVRLGIRDIRLIRKIYNNINHNDVENYLNPSNNTITGEYLYLFQDGGPIKDKRIKKYNNNSAGYLYDSFVTDNLEKGENPHNSRKYTIPEELAEKLGYYRDKISGHRDDAVKLQDHPSHNSRGTFKDIDGYHIFDLTDKGANDVNYTISGLIDNGDDHVIPIYNGSYMLPEITITPNGNYVHDTYNNLKWHSNKSKNSNLTKQYVKGGYIFPNNVLQHKFAEGGNPDGEDIVLIEPDTTADVLNVDTSRYDRNYLIDIDKVPKVNSLDEILNAKPEYVVPKGNAENTYAAKVNEHNNKNSSRDREARLESLKSKSEQEIKEIQRSYADQGFYDFELKTGKSKEARDIQRRLAKEEYISYKDVDGNIGSFTTKALLQMLIEKGYLPEFNEYGRPNKDGIIGKRTREAFKQYNRDYNVDGIAGTLTENIYLQGNKQTIVSAEGMLDLCAKWVSKLFETNIGNTKQNGVFGNAWNMLYNIKDQGGEILFNLYEDPAFDSVTTGNGVKNNVNRLLKTTDMNSLYSLLQVNDVVGIHMPSSSHFQEVLDSGTTYNTHVGIVTGFKDGVPIISHNIGGKVRTEPINNLTGSYYGKPSVTVASRPKNSSNVAQELVFDNNIKSTLHVPEGKENDLMSEYMDSLALSKQTFKDIYTGVDMDFIERASIGITGVETNFMNTKLSDLRKKGNPQALLRSAAHWVRQTNEEVKSQDLTKMKFNTLSSEYRKSIGLTSPEQLSEDPTVTGRAVFLTLCKYYDYFQRLAKENPKLGLTKLDIENATILSYNRGFASTHTLGFDKQGFGTPEELEYLRKSGEIGSREKDISSTNYKYLGDLGEMLYNRNYPEGSLTYVGRVRGYMEKI